MGSRSKTARNQNSDPTLDPYIPQDNDTIIFVLGQIGAGKSTVRAAPFLQIYAHLSAQFINSAIGLNHDFASVGHDMGGSHTTDIQPYLVPGLSTSKRRIVLVDTPGFNETSINDRQTLRSITQWLQTSCKPTTTIAGIIYVYEITQARLLPQQDYMHPRKFSGSAVAQHMVLATVKWNELPREKLRLGEQRERDMKTHWADIFDNGSRVIRFLDTRHSAQSIVSLLSRGTTVAVVQHELTRIFGILPNPTKPVEAKKIRKSLFSRLFGGK